MKRHKYTEHRQNIICAKWNLQWCYMTPQAYSSNHRGSIKYTHMDFLIDIDGINIQRNTIDTHSSLDTMDNGQPWNYVVKEITAHCGLFPCGVFQLSA